MYFVFNGIHKMSVQIHILWIQYCKIWGLSKIYFSPK